jgi:hypothetical protein
MKEQRKIVLNCLLGGPLTKHNLMEITYFKPYKMQMILDAMVVNEMLYYDEDDEVYGLKAAYEIEKSWSFKELLEVWR